MGSKVQQAADTIENSAQAQIAAENSQKAAKKNFEAAAAVALSEPSKTAPSAATSVTPAPSSPSTNAPLTAPVTAVSAPSSSSVANSKAPTPNPLTVKLEPVGGFSNAKLTDAKGVETTINTVSKGVRASVSGKIDDATITATVLTRNNYGSLENKVTGAKTTSDTNSTNLTLAVDKPIYMSEDKKTTASIIGYGMISTNSTGLSTGAKSKLDYTQVEGGVSLNHKFKDGKTSVSAALTLGGVSADTVTTSASGVTTKSHTDSLYVQGRIGVAHKLTPGITVSADLTARERFVSPSNAQSYSGLAVALNGTVQANITPNLSLSLKGSYEPTGAQRDITLGNTGGIAAPGTKASSASISGGVTWRF